MLPSKHKTKLYDDSASLEELKNPKPAETEKDSNDDEMSGAQEEQSLNQLEPPKLEELQASAEPQEASKKHPEKDQDDDDDVLDAHSKGEGNLQPHANAVQDPRGVGGRTIKEGIKMKKPGSCPSQKIKLQKEKIKKKQSKMRLSKMKKLSKVEKLMKKKMMLPMLSQKRKPKMNLIQNRVRNLLNSARRSQCHIFHSWKYV